MEIARKWWRVAASRRRRTSSSIIIAYRGSDDESEALVTATTTNKGHFVVYTSDGSRFVVPLAYLKSDIIRELLEMSADEFGFPGDGPITLPCASEFMDYVLSFLLRRRVSKYVERATMRCSGTSLVHQGLSLQTLVLHGF
ncbi:hypothetical protein QJS10_CPB15g00296 [Acorus calamus]|uniref:Uncharacterized protein n=1 Tax=Acorus calamus TaxID=4465 RepID=A0AAV9D8C3_ACOCL|nr:hypothetical protein QJS10_CPB15g00296 [Acorus calamus]